MKIAIMSYIHGNLPALQAGLAEIDWAAVDHIVKWSDTLGGPLKAARTADLLIQRQISVIAGNPERRMLTLPPHKMNASDSCVLAELSAVQRAWPATAPAT